MAYEFDMYRAFKYAKDGETKIWCSKPYRTRGQAAAECFQESKRRGECWTVKVITQFSDGSGKVLDTDDHIERHARRLGGF